MKFSPVIFFVCAAMIAAPSKAAPQCSRNADDLKGDMLTLMPNGEYCEATDTDRKSLDQELDADYKKEALARAKAERAYRLAVAAHSGFATPAEIAAAARARIDATAAAADSAGAAAEAAGATAAERVNAAAIGLADKAGSALNPF